MESVGYCVRVQAVEGYALKMHTLEYDHMIAVKHLGAKGDNPHYHLVIRTDVKAQAFRKRMKRCFPDGTGNAHMSIKPWDGDDKALSYLFHEEHGDEKATVIVCKGLTQERIDTLRAQNQTVQTLIVENKKKSSHLLWEGAYEHFKNVPEKDRKFTNSTTIASYMILDALRNDKYVPQAWLLKSMTFKVEYLLCNGNVDYEEKVAHGILEQLWPAPWSPNNRN
jgi:hypothetical protein